MRIVLQRVSRASVTVDGSIVSEIKHGLMLLLGVHGSDTRAQADLLAKKCVELRIFNDEAGKMNLALPEVGGEILVVSQFTLYADCSRGRRPGFSNAAPPDQANELYEYFVQVLRNQSFAVKTGIFGADMKVELVNDGPVTLVLESVVEPANPQ